MLTLLSVGLTSLPWDVSSSWVSSVPHLCHILLALALLPTPFLRDIPVVGIHLHHG